MLVASAALFALPFTDGVGIALVLLSAAGAGIATINCIANLAGFFSPSLVGWLNDLTGKQGRD